MWVLECLMVIWLHCDVSVGIYTRPSAVRCINSYRTWTDVISRLYWSQQKISPFYLKWSQMKFCLQSLQVSASYRQLDPGGGGQSDQCVVFKVDRWVLTLYRLCPESSSSAVLLFLSLLVMCELRRDTPSWWPGHLHLSPRHEALGDIMDAVVFQYV